MKYETIVFRPALNYPAGLELYESGYMNGSPLGSFVRFRIADPHIEWLFEDCHWK